MRIDYEPGQWLEFEFGDEEDDAVPAPAEEPMPLGQAALMMFLAVDLPLIVLFFWLAAKGVGE